MIVYDEFWKTLKKKGVSTYTLITEHKVSSSTIDKLRHNKGLNTVTINDLCRILDCDVKDIMKFEKDKDR